MKVAIIGLEGAGPDLVFDELLEQMPNLAQLIDRGIHGPIRSTDPPEGVPAWSVFATGKNPGRLGFTGLRNRVWQQTSHGRTSTYAEGSIASSLRLEQEGIWDIAAEADERVVLLGVPQTFPPEGLNGEVVTGPLTPSAKAPFTHPPELAKELQIEVPNFRVDAATEPQPGATRAEVLAAARRSTDERFAAARHLATSRPWELFFMVAMEPEFVQDAAWSTHDPDHILHEAPAAEDAEHGAGDVGEDEGNSETEPTAQDELRAYYHRLDEHIGELVDALPDQAAILVVSDRGGQTSHGSIALNDWLREQGYLVLEAEPDEPRVLDPDEVDWSKTRAWASGGAAGRIYLNVAGREPEGIVDPLDYEALRDEIRSKLTTSLQVEVQALEARVFKPSAIYEGPHVDEAPDLLCYVGDLRYRCEDRVGHEELCQPPQRGVDEAAAGQQGIFVLADPEGRFKGTVDGMELLDAAPTVLDLLGLPVPGDMEGRMLQPDGSLAQP